MATVPSRILSSACCTPSPETSRGDGWVLVLAPDLIDFVDVNDALLAALHIPIGILQQPQDDVLYVFTPTSAGFSQAWLASTDGERDIQDACQRLRDQRHPVAGSGRLAECWISTAPLRRHCLFILDALVVVVNRQPPASSWSHPDRSHTDPGIRFNSERFGKLVQRSIRLIVTIIL